MPQENGDVILQGHADRAFDRLDRHLFSTL